MEPLLYVIAIMGCADTGSACTQMRVQPTAFRTEASCRAAQDDALIAASDLDFPVILAECRATTMQMADARPQGDRIVASR
ncbi:hypothetical protein GGR88_002302 [Sphingomonas jejuensis]|uniref:Lipoprotein n=1 Tax=Sphingomonas jejuensis TaxID=904715 RepID=A0ABX0XN24_9SPHN|nr:hypothetical protein [Sphingomonas jejuensis]NJC34788.1 hypothetical protein [Sphingomonas jejuensis]